MDQEGARCRTEQIFCSQKSGCIKHKFEDLQRTFIKPFYYTMTKNNTHLHMFYYWLKMEITSKNNRVIINFTNQCNDLMLILCCRRPWIDSRAWSLRLHLHGLGHPRQPFLRGTLAEVTLSLFLCIIQATVNIRIANPSLGARQLGWESCLASADRLSLANGTTFLHINPLAR